MPSYEAMPQRYQATHYRSTNRTRTRRTTESQDDRRVCYKKQKTKSPNDRAYQCRHQTPNWSKTIWKRDVRASKKQSSFSELRSEPDDHSTSTDRGLKVSRSNNLKALRPPSQRGFHMWEVRYRLTVRAVRRCRNPDCRTIFQGIPFHCRNLKAIDYGGLS